MTISSFQQALELAEQHRQSGQWQEADRLCRDVLAHDPDNGDAWHLLGIVAFQTGYFTTAVDAMRKAVAAHPDRAHFHCNLGLALASTGKLDEAVACYRQALQIAPHSLDIFNNLGIALKAQGQLNEAMHAYRQALAIRPDSPEVWNNLGNALAAQNDWDRASEAFSKALALRPDYPDALNNLGFVQAAQNRLDDAIASYRRALSLRPDYPITLCNLGNALLAQSKIAEATAAYRNAVALQPDSAELHAALATGLLAEKDFPAAAAGARQAIALRPNFPEAQNILGNALLAMQEIDDAESAYRQALNLRPDFFEAQNNLGNALHLKADLPAALAAHRRALELHPDLPIAHWSIALILLLQGDFQNGWTEYEWRKKVPAFRAGISRFTQPMWDGSDLAGKRIFLHCEQAFGDTIHFARYVPLVAARGGNIRLLYQPPMRRVLESLNAKIEFISPGDPLPDFDVHCPLPSLPLAMGLLNPHDVPWTGPYFKSDPESRQKFSDVIAQGAGKLKVGLIWAGRASPPGRSIPLHQLAPIADPRIQFYSLQVGEGAEEAKSPPEGMNLIDATERIKDFADSAALMDQLDLIVTIDTAAAQLAGALGKRVLTLLKRVPDWRWILDRSDSPWYPTMKLFRQDRAGDWNPPVARLAAELKGILG
jgi:tetratricopeptide (TPR) repeat protein